MSSALIEKFNPELWDPFIDAITSVLGPITQFFAPLSALASSASGLL